MDSLNSKISRPIETQIAIETTGKRGSVAFLSGAKVLHHSALPEDARTAQSLIPTIQRLIHKVKTDSEGNGPNVQNPQASPVDFITIASGPGSFTGLRIGVTAAKTLSYAWQIPLVAVDSLAAIASQAVALAENPLSDDQTILAAIDAYRGQIFAAKFEKADLKKFDADSSTQGKNAKVHWNAQSQVLSKQQWDSMLCAHQDALMAGDEKLFTSIPAESRQKQCFWERCDAAGAGQLGHVAAMAGRFTDALALVPEYLKLSAAEEKAQAS